MPFDLEDIEGATEGVWPSPATATQSARAPEIAPLLGVHAVDAENASKNDERRQMCEPSVREAARNEEISASGRGAGGRFAAGNTASLRHGGRSRQVIDGQVVRNTATKDELIAPKVAAIVADLGGEVSTIKRGLVEAYVGVEHLAAWFLADVCGQGPLTAKGRTRATVTAYLACVDRLNKLGAQLGLDRRARDVGDLDPMADARKYQQQQRETR